VKKKGKKVGKDEKERVSSLDVTGIQKAPGSQQKPSDVFSQVKPT